MVLTMLQQNQTFSFLQLMIAYFFRLETMQVKQNYTLDKNKNEMRAILFAIRNKYSMDVFYNAWSTCHRNCANRKNTWSTL